MNSASIYSSSLVNLISYVSNVFISPSVVYETTWALVIRYPSPEYITPLPYDSPTSDVEALTSTT